MRPGRWVVDVGSPEWLACCAYHVSLARGAGEAEAARAHDEALEEAVRAKSDWMQVFENDLAKAAAALKYPVTKYEQAPYYAGVVPVTYEKEYHASIIRVGQLEAEVAALRAEVTRLAEWRLMVEQQRPEEDRRYEVGLCKQLLDQRHQIRWLKETHPFWRYNVALDDFELVAAIEEGAGVADEKGGEVVGPTLADHVEGVLEGLSRGKTTTSQEERLWRGLQDRKLGRITRR